MTLFFGALAFVILASRGTAARTGTTAAPWLIALEVAVLMAMPYVLLRLVDDFTQVRGVVKRAAELGLAAGIVATYATVATQTTPVATLSTPVTLYIVAYFFTVSAYCAIAFIRASHSSKGVTKRRMEAISLGSILLGTDLLIAGLTPLTPPDDRAVFQALAQRPRPRLRDRVLPRFRTAADTPKSVAGARAPFVPRARRQPSATSRQRLDIVRDAGSSAARRTAPARRHASACGRRTRR